MKRRLAEHLIDACAWIVPSGRRDEWRAEWAGELATLRERAERTRKQRSELRFAAGALAHALAELRQEWNADVLSYELKHAVRGHLRERAYALTGVLLIALGVGANTTVFTLVNAVLLQEPRGIAAPRRIVQIGRTGLERHEFDSWSYPMFRALRTATDVFSGAIAYESRDVTVGDDGDAQLTSIQIVSANYFRVLGAAIPQGRGFADEEDAAGAPYVAVISDAMWRDKFDRSPRAVGSSVRIRGAMFRIIGVAASDFAGADVGAPRPALWIPIADAQAVSSAGFARFDDPHLSWLWISARLRPDVSAAAAASRLRAMHDALQTERDGKVSEDLVVIPGLGLRPEERALASTISAALMAMVGVVLLIACANLAALLLARGAARQSEIGVRLAIGASRGRVARQLLIETTLIAIAGSAAAFVLTHWTARFVEWIMPYPISVSIQPDVAVLVFAVVIGVATAAAFGIGPAWRSTRVDLIPLLRGLGGGGSADRGRARAALLVAQIALSFLLLGAAGLLARTVQRTNAIDPGFRTRGILVGEVDVQTNDGAKSQELVHRLEQMAARAASTPGVDRVSLASSVPASGSMSTRTMWPAGIDPGSRRMIGVAMLVVDTGYFGTMDVPVLRGRSFDATLDRPGAPSAVIVNETLAKRFWPNENAVGKQIEFGTLEGQQRVTVVGVGRDARNRSLRAPPAPQAYVLLSQNPVGRSLLHVRARPGQSEAALSTALGAQLHGVVAGSSAVRFLPIRGWLARGYADVRLVGILGAAFGALALALAAAGLYGVMSYETARRRREYGVRLALGARAGQVHALVVGRSLRLTGMGIAIGAAAFALSSPLLKRWTFAGSAFDPVPLGAIAAVLAATALAAALGPAVTAGRADPMASLRAD